MNIPFLNKLARGNFSKLFGTTGSVLGIDVGTSSLKLVQLRREKDHAVLETYGELSSGPYHSIEPGRAILLEEEKITEMILDLKKEAGVSAKEAVLSIPTRYSFITLIEMPPLPPDELKEAIPFEARRYIPLPLQEVVFEWLKIPFSEEERRERQGKILVLLAAAKKDVVERYVSAVQKADLKLKGYEIEIFSAARSAIGRFRMPVMIFDLGALSLKIAVVEQGSLRMAHNIDRGSQQFTIALSQALGVDFVRAEEMKWEIGISQRSEAEGIRRVVTPFLDSLFTETDRLRTEYRRRYGKTVEKIVLLGGGSLMPGLLEYAIERFGIEVLYANPFQTLEYPRVMQQTIKNLGPSFGVSVGAALHGF